jgi:hypothetical protein
VERGDEASPDWIGKPCARLALYSSRASARCSRASPRSSPAASDDGESSGAVGGRHFVRVRTVGREARILHGRPSGQDVRPKAFRPPLPADVVPKARSSAVSHSLRSAEDGCWCAPWRLESDWAAARIEPDWGNRGDIQQASRKLLPPDVAQHMAIYGKHDYDSAANPVPEYATIKVMTTLQTLGWGDQSQAAAALDELSAAALASGGWAVYGAYSAVGAFLPSQSGSPAASALLDERVRFLRAESPPNWRSRLTVDEQVRYEQLFPGEL